MPDPGAQEKQMPSNPPSPAPTTRAERLAPLARRRRLIRTVSGVAGCVVVAVAIAVPFLAPFPTVSTAAEGQTVTPTPADSRLVCAGSFIDASDPETLLAIRGGEADFEPSSLGDDPPLLAQPDLRGNPNGIRSLIVPAGDGSGEPIAAGLVTQALATETVTGLTASACAEASADSWLVGGSTDVGNTSVLVLANVSEVAATVDLTLYGENGLVDAAGSTGIVVPPASVRMISLAGFAPDLRQPVVRVVSRGGEVAASLQSSAISGLTPIGAEVTAAGAAPSTSAVIPGFTIVSPTPVTASDDGTGSAGSPVLRILAPGETDATVTIRVSNEDPSGAGTSTSVVVPAGRATEVPLSDLVAGSYSVALSSDQPIVASGRTTSTGTAGTDYAWFVSTRADTAPFSVANTRVAPSVLHLRNDGQETANVTITSSSGDRTQQIGPATSVSISIGSEAITVASDQALYASVSLANAGLLASYPVLPPSPLASALTVYDH